MPQSGSSRLFWSKSVPDFSYSAPWCSFVFVFSSLCSFGKRRYVSCVCHVFFSSASSHYLRSCFGLWPDSVVTWNTPPPLLLPRLFSPSALSLSHFSLHRLGVLLLLCVYFYGGVVSVFLCQNKEVYVQSPSAGIKDCFSPCSFSPECGLTKQRIILCVQGYVLDFEVQSQSSRRSDL